MVSCRRAKYSNYCRFVGQPFGQCTRPGAQTHTVAHCRFIVDEQVIPSVLVICADDTITCERHNISGFVTLMILQLALSAVACLWIFTCFRAAPAHHPSEAAHEAAVRAGHTSTNEASREVLSQIKACCCNPQFAILAISFGIGLGMFSALLTVDEQLIRPGWLWGCQLINGGVVGDLLSGWLSGWWAEWLS